MRLSAGCRRGLSRFGTQQVVPNSIRAAVGTAVDSQLSFGLLTSCGAQHYVLRRPCRCDIMHRLLKLRLWFRSNPHLRSSPECWEYTALLFTFLFRTPDPHAIPAPSIADTS